MTNLQSEITKKSKCNVLNLSIKDKDLIKKDLLKRLKMLEKQLEKVKIKQYAPKDAKVKSDVIDIISDGIEKIKRTITVIEKIK